MHAIAICFICVFARGLAAFCGKLSLQSCFCKHLTYSSHVAAQVICISHDVCIVMCFCDIPPAMLPDLCPWCLQVIRGPTMGL